MGTFLSLIGVAALLAAFLVSLRHRTPRTPEPDQATVYAPQINGDSRLPSGAFFG